MKKISAVFLVLILYACTPPVASVSELPTPSVTTTGTSIPTATQTPRPTRTATATLIPCPAVGSPIHFAEIRLVFHERVSANACHSIQLYVSRANDRLASMGYVTGPMEVAVFATIDAVTDYTYETARLAGCNPDSKDIIRADWIRGGAMSTRGAVFLLQGRWGAKYDLASAIAHEITQVTMNNYLGSCQRSWTVPDWFTTGLAEYHAEIFTLAWGLTPWEEDLWRCHEPLRNLSPSNGDCIYMEAQMAFHLLRLKYGEDKALDVMIQMGKGKSFDKAFYDVYGIGVSAFSNEFDAYRLNGYKLRPVSTAAP